jgi:hypothetical protein
MREALGLLKAQRIPVVFGNELVSCGIYNRRFRI